MNTALIDTCTVIDIFKNNEKVLQVIRDWEDPVYTSTTVLGELYYGALHSANPDKHLEQIKNFLSTISVLKPNNETAFQYASTREALTKQGSLIPANDIWIAATAIQKGLKLFTRDVHFKRVESLDLTLYQ